ncbi:Mob1/phocein [Mycena sanguinolenta]|nr:Mob1/phocein [Mycena sanguinolenta]
MALVQRPLRGSRISTFYPVKSLPSLSSLDSAFQLQEYISLLIRLDVHDVDAIVSIPGRASAKQKEKEKERDADAGEDVKSVTVDEACWKYEQLRRLAQDLSHPLITMLQQVCTRTTCPEMKAGEWLYLCVAHGNDGAMEQCCAIDYILHTLDSATALLNSPRAFPSRLQIPPASHRHFTSLARRLGRIFAHAYFHHREEFEQAEAESSLYARFLALTEKFDLVPADFLVIPPRAVASSSSGAEDGEGGGRRSSMVPAPGMDVPPPTLLGAALHVDTSSSSSPGAFEGEQAQGVSPPGLEGAAGAGADATSPHSAPATGASGRRFGRSRTDTMMLEGEGRFPLSPATVAADADDAEGGSTGLDAALAAAGVGMLNPPSQAQAQEKEQAAAAEPSGQEQEGVSQSESTSKPESESDAPHERLPEEPPSTSTEPEPPSPTSDEEAVSPSEMGPVVSPSSSTAPQAESHPIMSMLERDQPETVGAGAGVPSIAVVPATPPAEEREQHREEAAKETENGKEESVKTEGEGAVKEGVQEEEAAVPPAPAEPTKEAAPPAAADAETPAPTVAPGADEEVDVTDTEKDTEVPAVAEPAQEPPKTAD